MSMRLQKIIQPMTNNQHTRQDLEHCKLSVSVISLPPLMAIDSPNINNY